MAQSLAEVVGCARHGDEDAWGQLFRRYDGVLRWVGSGFRLDRDQVADAAQTTWSQLVREIAKVRDPDKLGGWLCVTMRRECIRLASRRDREELRDEWRVDELGVDGCVEGQILSAERDTLLWQAVDRLPQRQRELVLALLATPPPSYEDLARRLSMPIGSIGPTRARALRNLRQLLVDPDAVVPARRSRRGAVRAALPAGRSSAQKYQGNGDQSGSRFSRNASRPSTASSVM